jgi:glycosyltransferase involved in cell wall biosynthesis
MKVLWFSNTPANGIRHFDHESLQGGWLQSLDELIQEKIELHVAFYYPGHFTSFIYGKTVYHPISRKNWKLSAIRNSLLGKVIFKEDLDFYTEIIEKVQPDLIHIHGTENPFGYILRNVKIPSVISIQGIISVYVHKYSIAFEDIYLNTNSNTIRDGLKHYLLNKNFLKAKKGFVEMQKREVAILANATHLLGRTSWDRRVMNVLAPQARYYHSDELLRSSFYKHEWQCRDIANRFIIFTTNDNNPYKGFETVCETILLLNHLQFDFEWRVAGITSSDLIVKIIEKKLGINFPIKNLTLLGKQPEKVILQNLLDAHLYIMPSHIENSPNNLCEAMVLGLPCLATFAGGTDSILEHNVAGILVQDGDPWSMAGAIREIKDNYELAIERGKKAREIALHRHDRSKNVTHLLGIYTSIIHEYNQGAVKSDNQ